MQTDQISLGAIIYVENPIVDGSDIHFWGPSEGPPFAVKRFGSSDEASNFYTALRKKWNKNMASVYPPFEAEGGHYIAFEKLGIRLSTFLPENRAMFSAFNSISRFYQTILEDLLLLVNHFMGTPIKPLLTLNNIYISNYSGQKPHVSVTNFELRGHETQSDWEELGRLIANINMESEAIFNAEMRSLVVALDNPTRDSLDGIARSTLFWTLPERRLFFCTLVEYLEKFNMVVSARDIGTAFGTDATNWQALIDKDADLTQVKTEMHPNLLKYASDGSDWGKAAMDCMEFIRTCLIHPLNMGKRMSFKDLTSVDDFQGRINALFPDHIWFLSQYARSVERNAWTCLQSKRILLPQLKESLTKLTI